VIHRCRKFFKYKSIFVLAVDVQSNLMEGQFRSAVSVLAPRQFLTCVKGFGFDGSGKERREVDDMGTPCKYFPSFFFPKQLPPPKYPLLFFSESHPPAVTLTPFKKIDAMKERRRLPSYHGNWFLFLLAYHLGFWPSTSYVQLLPIWKMSACS
jgi:hypothetical protein